jgi:hypothetical protein
VKPSSAKAKGRRAQNEVVAVLREFYPDWEEDDVRPAVMGEAGEDVKLSPRARRDFPWTVEVKNVERLNIWEALKQAMGRKHRGLLFFRRNRSDLYVALRAHDFLEAISDE